PEYTEPEYPYGVKQTSTKNTPIESFWHWRQDGEGHSVRKVLQAPWVISFPMMLAVFYWLWPPIVQQGLDIYREYWNNHTLSGSKNKKNLSRSCPNNMFLNPASISIMARDCSISVNPATVKQLWEAYGGREAQERAYCFVSDEFKFNMDVIHENMGSPVLTLQNGWAVFKLM
ncbi:hypothetical protein C8R43DRAFT_841936, partial [Mycena crocata]